VEEFGVGRREGSPGRLRPAGCVGGQIPPFRPPGRCEIQSKPRDPRPSLANITLSAVACSGRGAAPPARHRRPAGPRGAHREGGLAPPPPDRRARPAGRPAVAALPLRHAVGPWPGGGGKSFGRRRRSNHLTTAAAVESFDRRRRSNHLAGGGGQIH
jgi:hypothetical protein